MKNKRILILASATTFLPLVAISCTKTKEVKKVEEENKNNKVMNPSDQQGAQSSKPGSPDKNGQKDQKPKQGQSGNTNQDGLTKQGQSGNNQQDGSSANNADNGRVQQDDPMSDQETPKTQQNDQLTEIKAKYESEYKEAKLLFSDEELDKEQITELESINKTITDNSTVQDYEAAIKKINELLSKNDIQTDERDAKERPLEEVKKEYEMLLEEAGRILEGEDGKKELEDLKRINDQIPSIPRTYDYETAIEKINKLIGDNEDDEDADAESVETK
ncbi:Uncharacterised protein [Mycoplasmopsis bovigenitalium]|uniref:Lipoprotein n=1 Tax=Mycoplasmopsis bovigenitalium TaxID=2112 RepID=A0A449A9A7_9BACT|nr:variable surface lipoprotein [Mycoplasmopsis bovigenitalium]VEU60863.1 Uncharacterised protein [Mycoplasmopsis bovigenitalium]